MFQEEDNKLDDFYNDFINLNPENQDFILRISKKLLAVQMYRNKKSGNPDEGEADDRR
ncbi:MAG: hypothetical protein LBP27_02310 [Treponema sp.]|jgi:hypothetical protein|nr:hypothetical protein [Treponema sp.]